ncbi:VOC family protein [Acuticoccus mangrovi]|uniref:VOC family protein n=1 Tax=Acuticoccus mangrovi TaxID=2796142 RepID=A0A934IGY9_9HYPH|nr:VOC family protein [Acuticoccus mangrovi]MBJ3776509.1 VOC family protein [Acuticoccus mangrovi]
MTKTPVEPPRLYPTLRCRDADAMIAFLTDVVGFTLRAAYREGAAVKHAELAYGSSILMLGTARDDAYGELAGDLDGRRTDALYLAVADPDALHAKVIAAGATIAMDPHDTDYGSRDFAFRDPEANLWSVGTYWPSVGEPPLA